MLKTQCRFKKGNTYTVGWVDAKKIKGKKFVQLLDFGDEFWEVIAVGNTKEYKEVHTTFRNNHTEKFGNKTS